MKSDPFSALVRIVNQLGRAPKGFDRKGKRPDALFKAIFNANKETVSELWEIYTQRRDELSRKLINNKQSVVAYLLGFHMSNMARAAMLYERSNARHQWKKKLSGQTVRIYDIGCGTAAMSLALDVDGEYFLVDGSGPLLDAASLLAKESGLKAKTSRKVIEDLDAKHFTATDTAGTTHIYLLGYVWNELSKNTPAKRKLLSILTKHIEREQRALVFIAEPALDFMARPAMELRDVLTSAGYQAMYPCPHSHSCPMLERPKDWCYSEGEWTPPPLAEWIDDKLGMNRARFAGSMFAFASPAMGIQSDQKPIVVGRPVRDEGKERYKGFFDYLICDQNGISKLEPKAPKQVAPRGTILNETLPKPAKGPLKGSLKGSLKGAARK
jgi:SAM-dependent methyltransferase